MNIKNTLPYRVFDNKAMTISEIADEVPCSLTMSSKFVRGKMKSGDYEQVWKMVGNRPVKAYRLKKK